MKSIYETLAALGAGAILLSGCASSNKAQPETPVAEAPAAAPKESGVQGSTEEAAAGADADAKKDEEPAKTGNAAASPADSAAPAAAPAGTTMAATAPAKKKAAPKATATKGTGKKKDAAGGCGEGTCS